MGDVSSHVCPACWRYGSDDMRAIFTEDAKLTYSLQVEAALAWAEADLGIIPREAAEEIARKATTEYVTPEAVFAREKEIRHDVMAMVQILTEACDGDAGNYVHYGATSYDIEDNRLSLQMQAAAKVLRKGIAEFGKALKGKAKEYRDLPCVGRTHVIWAEPITFGFKFAKYMKDAWDDYGGWAVFLNEELVGKPMTGAVGTANSYLHIAGDKERAASIGTNVMVRLGLMPARITDQVISRKMHARAAELLAQTAMTGYKFAQEFYDLGRPEIGEVMPAEPKIGVVGSSAMPHKSVLKNDIDGENIMSLARMVAAFVPLAYANIPLRHERDLTNSGNERIWIPQAFLYTDEIMGRCAKKLGRMVVDEDGIRQNLERATAFTVTEPVMMELVEEGLGRQEAHELLQGYALRMKGDPDADPVKALVDIPEISSRIPEGRLREILEEHRGYTGLSREIIDEITFDCAFQ